ncbi:ASKHA domain-containing protein [Poriferisphaera sp. WC338]|uniref:ASKHA domain-containing protein n=1 Tax=Poriferisphaera sp. WC338 TaxID=3425129 RepID=UPI003D815BAA
MTIKPQQICIHAPSGKQVLSVNTHEQSLRLSDLLRQKGLPLNIRCGEEGACEGCQIELLQGSLRTLHASNTVTAGSTPSTMLACQHRLGPEPVTLQISPRSLAAYEPAVLNDFRINIPYSQNPLHETLNTSEPTIGAAIDIGTTTVSLLLIDLSTGKILANASTFNHQMYLGDDVITRINLCRKNPTQITQLQNAIVHDTLSPLLKQAAKEVNVRLRHIACITVAANTTMLHLLVGKDPSQMGTVPFEPVFLEHLQLTLQDVGLDQPFNPNATLHLLPSAAAYIGADLTAGVLVSGLCYEHGPSLLVDIGTNGEIILTHNGILYACATAAGPAFEGAGLTHGCRAGSGAISHITLSNNPFNVTLDIIDNAPPTGICGSAYIDFLAQAARIGLLTPSGRFNLEHSPEAKARLQPTELHGRSFELTTGIVITEADIAKLLQAKAAIAAGILTLLDRCNVSPTEVDRLYLAGGFGMNVNNQHAITCGLLPKMRVDQIELVGNSSLAGAFVALMDRHLLPEIAKISQHMQTIELNLDPDFENRYIDELMLA